MMENIVAVNCSSHSNLMLKECPRPPLLQVTIQSYNNKKGQVPVICLP